jgi:hypothetical protein
LPSHSSNFFFIIGALLFKRFKHSSNL